MWRWQNLVVVLTEQTDRSQPPLQVLTGLDASTGQTRWTLPMGAGLGGGVGGLSPTADGGLAILRGNGVLEVVDLSSGRVRWRRWVAAAGVSPVAVGGTVLFAASSQLTSYDDRTGQVRWTDVLRWPWESPGSVQASAGLVYLIWEEQRGSGGQVTPVVLGVSAGDGRVQWHFVPNGLLDTLVLDAPGLMSIATSAYSGTSQDELDPATGRVRWRVVSHYPAIATRAGIVTAPGPDRISMRDTLTGQTRWTARLKGGWLPLVVGPLAVGPGPWQAYPGLPVFPAAPLLVVPAAGPDGSDLLAAFRMSDGHRAWQVTTGPVAAPPSAVPGGILVYAA